MSPAGQAQFVILVTDAPCHGGDFHVPSEKKKYSNSYDSRPNENAQSRAYLKEAFTHGVNKNVVTMFCSCHKIATERTTDIMKELSIAQANEIHKKHHGVDAQEQGNRKKYFIPTSMFQTPDQESEENSDSSSGCHVVFVLDESGSMSQRDSGSMTRWELTVQAFNDYRSRRLKNQGLNDVVSIINFASSARVCKTAERIQDVKMSDYKNGGTSFAPAAQCAYDLITTNNPPGKNPVVVMMTDGEAGDASSAHQHFVTLNSWCDRNGFKFQLHVIAAGQGASTDNVKVLAGNIGRWHNTSFRDLGHTFTKICEDNQANDKLYKAIGQQITDGVTKQITDDFL